jgi:hypothetical protein
VKRCKDLEKYFWERRLQILRLDHTAMDGEHSYTLGLLPAVGRHNLVAPDIDLRSTQ